MKDLDGIDIKQPEYLSWPLERLQREYHRLDLAKLGQDIRLSDMESRQANVNEFVGSLKRLLGEERL